MHAITRCCPDPPLRSTCFEFSTPAGMMTPKIMIMSSSPAVGETGSPAVRDSVKRKREAIFFDDSVPSSPNGVGNSLNKSAVDMVTDVKVRHLRHFGGPFLTLFV